MDNNDAIRRMPRATNNAYRKWDYEIINKDKQRMTAKIGPSASTKGSTGIAYSNGQIDEEFLPQLKWPDAANVYHEMASNDAVIGGVLYLAEALIRGVSWEASPAKPTLDGVTPTDAPVSTEAQEAASFLESCMNDMALSWQDTICEILSMLVYGFSLHAIEYKVRRGPLEKQLKFKSKYSDGKVGWKGMPIRAQKTLTEWFLNEATDEWDYVVQEVEGRDKVEIPLSSCLLFRTKCSKNNPLGKSLLRNAYKAYYFKKNLEEIEGIGIERDLAGLPVLTGPEGVDLYNANDPAAVAMAAQATELVRGIRRDSEEGVVKNFGWTLELLSSGSSRQFDIDKTISRYDSRIAMTLLSDILLLGGQSGSFALASAKESVLAQALQSQLSNIAEVLNAKAVPDLMTANGYPVEVWPTLVPGRVQTPSIKETALMLRALGLDINADIKLQNHLRHIMGMPTVTQEEFDNLRATQVATNGPAGGSKGRVKDTAERSFEQNEEYQATDPQTGGDI